MDKIKEMVTGVAAVKEAIKNYNEKEVPIEMGMGKLGSPDVILVREFRWILEAPGLDKSFIQRVEFDFVHHTVKLSALEAVMRGEKEIQLQTWLEKPTGPMVFTTCDGCGERIYRYELDNLEKMADTIVFDYTSSLPASRKVTIFYGSIKKESLLTGSSEAYEKIERKRKKNERCKVADRKRRDARRSRKHGKNDRCTKASKY